MYWWRTKTTGVTSLQLHPPKLTCPLKRDYFSREYIFQPLIFRGHVCFQGSILIYIACYINLFTRFLPSVFWRSISICLFICSSFSVKNGHPLFICLTAKHHSALYDICIDFRVQPSMIVLLSAESRGQPPKKCHWLMLEDFGSKKSPTKNWIKDVPNPNMRNPPQKRPWTLASLGISLSRNILIQTQKKTTFLWQF